MKREREPFLEALAVGYSVTHAAQIVGVSKARFYELRAQDDDFAAEWERAYESGTDVLVDEVRRRALEGWEEPVYQGGKLVGPVRKYSDNLLMFLVKQRDPSGTNVPTDAQRAAQVQAELAMTTVTYPAWVKAGRKPGHWLNALNALGQIGTTPARALTGTHWPAVADFPTLAKAGFDFAVVTVDPTNPALVASTLAAAQSEGLKLIIGGWPYPYTIAADGTITVTSAGAAMIRQIAASPATLALFVFNEPYWINPFTGIAHPEGALSAAQLRALRTAIHQIAMVPVYHDLGTPSQWAPGGSLAASAGQKYASQNNVADLVGLWDYPYPTGQDLLAQSIQTLKTEAAFATARMGAKPVWLVQTLGGEGFTYPTTVQMAAQMAAVENLLEVLFGVSAYTWSSTGGYSDFLSNHSPDWPTVVGL